VRRVTALLLLFVLALVSCGGDEAETTQTTETTTTETTTTETATTETTDTLGTTEPELQRTVRVTVENGAPKGGIVRATIDKGRRVVLVVRSDVADEIHLHGYDLSTDVAAGGTARLRFRANVTGRFEVELEKRSVQIADLTVR
jgi:putative cell wall-binding protein